MTPAKPTRGERNHNPGNIREGHNDTTKWRGERATDDDKAFEEFNTPHDGIRALAKVLLTYYRKYGLNTIEGIITRWAPDVENNTEAYIAAVARNTGLARHKTVNLEDHGLMERLVVAIIQHENGRVIYERQDIRAAVDAAY